MKKVPVGTLLIGWRIAHGSAGAVQHRDVRERSPGEITPGILPFAFRAVLWTLKIVPDEFVELGVRTSSSNPPSMKEPAVSG